MKKSFSDFFPLPRFLEMHPAGLAISESSVRIVELVKSRRGLVLGKFGAMKVPDGAIKKGHINDKIAAANALRSLQRKLSIEFVRVSIPDEKAYLFTTKVPKSAEADLRRAIALRLEESVPLSSKEAVFDFVVIPNQSDEDNLEVGVSVLPSKVSGAYADVIKEAGFKPVSLCTESEALGRAVVPTGNVGTFMVVNVGENRTGLSIASRGVVQFSAVIRSGGGAITAALEKHFGAGTGGAIKIKEERGFAKSPENTKLFFPLMSSVSPIKDEIIKMVMSWHVRKNSSGQNGGGIEKIILCGRDANLVGFYEYLLQAIKIPIEAANVWQNAFSYDDFLPSISFLDSLDYASAIGLALPDSI